MDSLTTDPVAAVLRRLYQEAERADRPLMERYRDRGVAFDELLKAEAKDYRAVYRTYANNFLNVSADFGRFLYMCARARKAKRIVEFGTSFGISTIHLACALAMAALTSGRPRRCCAAVSRGSASSASVRGIRRRAGARSSTLATIPPGASAGHSGHLWYVDHAQ